MAKKKESKALIPWKTAMLAANKYILFHYPTLFTGGMPRRLECRDTTLWIVPIVLTHPEAGVLGEAGHVAINGRTGEVIGSTPRAEVVAAGKRLREAWKDDLEAAFLPARAR